MSDFDYLRCRFSITCHADDLAIVHCLRPLCEFAEKDGKKQIGWGGSGCEAWLTNGKRITLRFTQPEYREVFVEKAMKILPPNSWS